MIRALRLSFLVISAVGLDKSRDDSLRPVVALTSGNAQLLVGESVTMVCIIPGNSVNQWTHWWFKDGVPVRPFGLNDNSYTLTPTLPQRSGQYTCQGRANTMLSPPGDTLPSLPLKIDVVGGWVVLLVPQNPSLIGENLTLTCHVWASPKLIEVVFFKDGYELQRQPDPHLRLSHLTEEDRGTYWCRATWTRRFHWHSAQSLAVEVAVKDVLTRPQLTVLSSAPILQGQRLILGCHTKLHSKQPGLQLRYYFYREGQRLGLATSQPQMTIWWAMQKDSGLYWCKVAVGSLGLTKSSSEVEVKVLEEAFEESSGSRAAEQYRGVYRGWPGPEA